LLALHSTYFSNIFGEKGPGVEKKISISAKPSLFADFVSWIYFGEFLKVKNDALEGDAAVDDLWALGRFFKAPAFQNFCMDDCRTYCKASETDPTQPWPFIKGIKLMYSITPRGSELRKLAVDSLTYKNPLQEHKKGSAVWKQWKTLLTGQNSKDAWVNDLRENFALEAGTDWKKIPPVSAFRPLGNTRAHESNFQTSPQSFTVSIADCGSYSGTIDAGTNTSWKKYHWTSAGRIRY
jgi:hypothetical protein